MKAKLILLFSAVLITLISINSCKKDYPKDIPKWLKEMIKDRKKECKKDACGGCSSTSDNNCWLISEYEKKYETIYVIYKGTISTTTNLQNILIYNSNGELKCDGYYDVGILKSNSTNFGICDSIFDPGTLIRVIWRQNHGN